MSRSRIVMAGLVPAIHAMTRQPGGKDYGHDDRPTRWEDFIGGCKKICGKARRRRRVDSRDKPGQDEPNARGLTLCTTLS